MGYDVSHVVLFSCHNIYDVTFLLLTNQRPRKGDKIDKSINIQFDIMTTSALRAVAIKLKKTTKNEDGLKNEDDLKMKTTSKINTALKIKTTSKMRTTSKMKML